MQPAQQNTWHVARGGQTYGPYTWEQIVEHTSGGRIGRRDKILDPRTGTWAKPSQVPGLLGSGGAAVIPAGLSVAAKVAVGVILGLAIVLGVVTSIRYMPTSLDEVKMWFDTGSGIVAQNDTPITAATAVVPPEGLAFKGTFHYQTAERDAPGGALQWDDPCYLWIYMYDDGTCASFDFGTVDGWPVYLLTQAGSHYVFESSKDSMVERVRVVVDITDTSMSGTVTNITPEISSFMDGTFTGQAITYEQYKAERP